jgi:hypothetical protein
MRTMFFLALLAGCGEGSNEGSEDAAPAPPEPTMGETSWTPPPSWTTTSTTEAADPWFEVSLDGETRATEDGRYRVDSAQDLVLGATLADGGDVDLYVIGTVDGPGSYAVTDVQYYRYDDPFSALGAWSSEDDPGSMQLHILSIEDGRMQAEWSGSVQLWGIDSDGSSTSWTVGSGFAQDWPGSGLDDGA